MKPVFRPLWPQQLFDFSKIDQSALNSSMANSIKRKNKSTRLPNKKIRSNKKFCVSNNCSLINKVVISASNTHLNQGLIPTVNTNNRLTQQTIKRDIRTNVYNIPTNSYLLVFPNSITTYFGSDISNEKQSVVWQPGSVPFKQTLK